MRILFFTLVPIADLGTSGIYQDLANELCARGHEVVVVSPAERREGKSTRLYASGGGQLLRVKTLNNTKVGLIEKAFALLTTPLLLERAVRRYVSGAGFDLLLYATPPLTLAGVIRRLKKRFKARTYLMLKDIWPQTGVDLGVLREGGLMWRFLAAKEKRLLAVSDTVGCMSPGNVAYVKARFPEYMDKLTVLPNAVKPGPKPTRVPHERLTLVYGGSFGPPQGVSFILDVLARYQGRTDLIFVLIGAGTEYARVEAAARHMPHVMVMPMMPKDAYYKQLGAADIGLVFLSERFTVPNMPSRVLDYMMAGLPVLAAVDRATDFAQIIQDGGFGLASASGDLEAFDAHLQKLADAATRQRMGEAGRRYLEAHWTVEKACDTMLANERFIGEAE